MGEFIHLVGILKNDFCSYAFTGWGGLENFLASWQENVIL